jgi:multiple sugar transport system substrate-binding protein
VTDIDRSSPIPLYHQLKTLIRERIESGAWCPGERIPTEQELCRLYGISRSPVRQALSDLAHDGLLVRRPGQGTFVQGHVPAGRSPDAPIQMMSSDPYWSGVLDQVSDVWNAEHPDRKVGFQVEVVDHSQFYSLLSTAVGSGMAPDVAMVDCVWVAGLAQSGFLYAFEDLGTQRDRETFIGDLYPAFVEANSFGGRLYGLPVKVDASLLWYRKDWFAQEGLEPPQDWDDLLQVARHFRQPQVQERYGPAAPLVFPGGTAGGEATVYTLMPFVWSAGGAIFDAEAGHVVLDGPGARRALQFVRELVTLHQASPPDVVNYRWDTTPWLFANGKVAMALGGSYESPIIRDASGWGDEEFVRRVGCVAPPAAPGGQPVSTVGGTSYVIMRQCQRPALVMDVLKKAISPNVVGDMYRAMSQSSPCPSFYAFLSPEAEPLLTRVSGMIALGRARPSIPEYVKVSRQLQGMFEAAISNTASIDEIVRRTAEFIGAISERPCRSV